MLSREEKQTAIKAIIIKNSLAVPNRLVLPVKHASSVIRVCTKRLEKRGRKRRRLTARRTSRRLIKLLRARPYDRIVKEEWKKLTARKKAARIWAKTAFKIARRARLISRRLFTPKRFSNLRKKSSRRGIEGLIHKNTKLSAVAQKQLESELKAFVGFEAYIQPSEWAKLNPSQRDMHKKKRDAFNKIKEKFGLNRMRRPAKQFKHSKHKRYSSMKSKRSLNSKPRTRHLMKRGNHFSMASKRNFRKPSARHLIKPRKSFDKRSVGVVARILQKRGASKHAVDYLPIKAILSKK